MEQAPSRRVAVQRRAVNQCRRELASLTRLRSDLGRQLAKLDAAAGEVSEMRRQHLSNSIQQVEQQMEEARAKFEGAQRVLHMLEHNPEPDSPRRRRTRAR